MGATHFLVNRIKDYLAHAGANKRGMRRKGVCPMIFQSTFAMVLIMAGVPGRALSNTSVEYVKRNTRQWVVQTGRVKKRTD